MSLKVAKTPEGLVCRIIRAGGECSYRKNIDGTWAMTGDHKGLWIALGEIDVPKTARIAIAAITEDMPLA
jgi:hypothetical protein